MQVPTHERALTNGNDARLEQWKLKCRNKTKNKYYEMKCNYCGQFGRE